MSRRNRSPRDDPLEGQWLAYLDGQLDGEARRQVETLLAADPQWQARIEQHRSLWRCLDLLPRASVDESFTRTTVEMAALTASTDATRWKAIPRGPVVTRLITVAGCFAALAAAFLASFILWPDPLRRLQRDAPLLEQLDAYTHAGDMQFIRLLAEHRLFDSPQSDAVTPEAERGGPAESSQSDTAHHGGLDLTQPAELLRKQQQFLALSPQQQQSLKELHEQVAAAPDAAKLRRVLTSYHHWVRELTAGQRAELASLPPPSRIEKVREILARQAAPSASSLTPADVRVLLDWFDGLTRLLRPRPFDPLPQAPEGAALAPSRERLRNMPPHYRRMAMMLISLQGRRFAGRWESLVSERDLERLEVRLSPQARKVLSDARSATEKKRIVLHWIRSSLREQLQLGPRSRSDVAVGQEQLEDFFEHQLADNDLREELLELPREEFLRQLQELYNRWLSPASSRVGQ